MSKVFIIQEPVKHGPNGMEPLMDFRKVLEYGDPIICLPPGKVSLSPGPTIDMLRDKLRTYTDNDYIVSVGDPSAIFIAAMLVGELNRGCCKLLKWDKDIKRYIEVKIDLHHRRKGEFQ